MFRELEAWKLQADSLRKTGWGRRRLVTSKERKSCFLNSIPSSLCSKAALAR